MIVNVIVFIELGNCVCVNKWIKFFWLGLDYVGKCLSWVIFFCVVDNDIMNMVDNGKC